MKRIPFTVLSAAIVAAAQADHIHITVDTPSGTPGEPILIRAGYLPTESHISIGPNGRLLDNGLIAVFELHDQLAQPGFFSGWFAHDAITLTSDYYFAAGHLSGGDFNFEIVGITPILGPSAEFAHGEVHGGIFESDAVSSGVTREDRSYNVGVGSHQHGQASALSRAGIYDVEIRAWDANGVYLDSDLIIIRFDSGACYADCDQSGSLDLFDFLCFVNDFGQAGLYADCDLNEQLDLFDFLCFTNAFGAGCP